jgi:hypothetical protein
MVQRHFVLHLLFYVNAMGVAAAVCCVKCHVTCFECCRPHGLQIEAQQLVRRRSTQYLG